LPSVCDYDHWCASHMAGALYWVNASN
jgi:hypothetical protein